MVSQGVPKQRLVFVIALAAAFLFVGPATTSGLVDPGLSTVPDGQQAPACSPDPVRSQLDRTGVVPFTEEPNGGTWQTWFVGPADITVPPPPAAGSVEDLAELSEVKQATMQRTGDEAVTAGLYGDGPAGRYWTQLYLDLIVEHAAKDGAKNPPQLSRQMALVETALFDAFVIAWHYKYCYQRAAPAHLDPTMDTTVDVPPAPSYPSEHAAAAGVVHALFPHFFPCDDPTDLAHCEEQPAFWIEERDSAMESRILAGANYRSDVDAGYALGLAVGEAVWDARKDDGYDAPWDGSGQITGPCNWLPNPDGHGSQFPLEPMWGQVTPFVMSSGSQFRAPPPPACDGPDYMAQNRDVYEASRILTDRQRDISEYWEMGQGTVTPPGQNLEIALGKVLDHEFNTLRAQRVLAYEGVAIADAGIAAWETKYHYWWDRPMQVVRRHSWDSNDGLCDGVGEHATYVYGGCWESYATTPPFPGYISGHSTFTGAGQETLKYFFPEDDREFNAYQTEAAMARFYGGIHFRHDNDQGLETGRSIGHLLWERAANDGADL